MAGLAVHGIRAVASGIAAMADTQENELESQVGTFFFCWLHFGQIMNKVLRL
jgi:hypothetical protein